MANPTRILFVSGEVAPFAKETEVSDVVRTLPERLQEAGNYEMRIMMPRYGVISERRNRLHEVIRLSGTDIRMGSEKETLKVKVASIPGIRLQVYFMDNNKYFKRKGILTDKQGKLFEDNAQRALFFARAVLTTLRNLGWSPDLVHAFGAMSAFVPTVLRTEFASEPLFQNAKSVFTPNRSQSPVLLSEKDLSLVTLDGSLGAGRSLDELAAEYADAVVEVQDLVGESDSDPIGSAEEMTRQATSCYEQVLGDVVA